MSFAVWEIKVVIQTFFFFFLLAEFGVHLAELTVDPQGALAIRQVSLPGTIERILTVVSVVIKVFSRVSR